VVLHLIKIAVTGINRKIKRHWYFYEENAVGNNRRVFSYTLTFSSVLNIQQIDRIFILTSLILEHNMFVA
jgi:hypothetical protein